MKKTSLLLGLLVAATAHAQVNLTISYLSHEMIIPGNHQSIIGLGVVPAGQWLPGGGPGGVIMMTEVETWASNATGTTTFFKVFDPIIAGTRLNRDSRVVYDPATQLFLFTGGTFDVRLYSYSPGIGSLLNGGGYGETMLDLGDQPAGLAVRNGTNDVFASFGGGSAATGYTPSLYRYTVGAGDQNGVVFGNTGLGAVSAQVGAMVMGPDGRLNVLDTGLQKILRYDPVTLAYLDAIALVNTTTDKASFAISSTGYIFTADLNSTSGVIYDYATGAYVGTFMDPSHPPNGELGRLVMTADDVGNVYVSNIKVNEHLSVFSTAAIPEPGTYALFAGLLTLGCIMIRRRRGAR
jgi:hypothetical protein